MNVISQTTASGAPEDRLSALKARLLEADESFHAMHSPEEQEQLLTQHMVSEGLARDPEKFDWLEPLAYLLYGLIVVGFAFLGIFMMISPNNGVGSLLGIYALGVAIAAAVSLFSPRRH